MTLAPRISLPFLLVATMLCASSAFAQPEPGSAPTEAAPTDAAKAKASEHFQRGIRFYRERDFRNALIEFTRAHEVVPSYQVLFNLGQTSFELKDYVEAQKSFEQYLAQGGSAIDAERRAEVEAELEKLKGYVGHLEITVNVDGAEVAIDDIAVGVSPLAAPVLVSAGRRKIELRKEGYAPLVRQVDVAGGDKKISALELVSLEVKAVPDPVPPTKSATNEQDSASPSLTGVWVGVGLTAAFGVATIVTGSLALKADGDHEDELGRFPNDKATLDDAADDVTRFALLTDIFGAVTGAAAIATVVVAVVVLSSDEDETEPTVGVSLGPGSLTVQGSF